MAASARPESHSKPMSRRRQLYGRDPRPRRGAHNEQQHLSRSPPRQMAWSSPAPMSIASNSTTSLNTPLEHAHGITMERTPSGNSIISDPRFEQEPNHTLTSRDLEAARFVLNHMERGPSRWNHEDIFKSLINRHDHIDDQALDGILTTADSIFFSETLYRRVQWEWSSDDRYQTELIGTTALRRCSDRDGFETLIVLSAPILRNPKYDRRLLLSAFLHELIHCYLFIKCGFEARMQGGHTTGFHMIARAIHGWVEEWHPGYLELCNMKANLNRFDKTRVPMQFVDPRVDVFRDERRHGHEGCNQSPRPDCDHIEASGVRPLALPPRPDHTWH
jgi:hypothetical protein